MDQNFDIPSNNSVLICFKVHSSLIGVIGHLVRKHVHGEFKADQELVQRIANWLIPMIHVIHSMTKKVAITILC